MLTPARRALPLVLGLLLTVGSARAADVKITDEARKHFNAGVALLRDPDGARYEEAYREFKVAYAASPSWKILGNLGLAAMKLERDGEAIAAFERYLSEGRKDLDASERADIERDLSTLRSSAATLTLTTTPAVVTIMDERAPVQGTPVRNRYQSEGGTLKLLIRPGHHVIVANVEGKPPLTWQLDAEPGSSHQHDFNLDTPTAPATATEATTTTAPAPPPPTASKSRPVPASVWIGLAATGVFAVGAGVTGAMALGKNADYEQANGQDPVKAKGLLDETKTMNLVTDVLIGAAVVSAGITTFLYLRRPEREMGTEVRISPHFGLRDTGLSLQGSF